MNGNEYEIGTTSVSEIIYDVQTNEEGYLDQEDLSNKLHERSDRSNSDIIEIVKDFTENLCPSS